MKQTVTQADIDTCKQTLTDAHWNMHVDKQTESRVSKQTETESKLTYPDHAYDARPSHAPSLEADVFGMTTTVLPLRKQAYNQ